MLQKGTTRVLYERGKLPRTCDSPSILAKRHFKEIKHYAHRNQVIHSQIKFTLVSATGKRNQ